MLVLAMDTSSAATTVAIADDTGVLAERTDVAPNRHAEVLAPLVDDLLRTAGVGRHELTEVAVGVGPGPFTGLRVGIVTALAMADALRVAVVGVCSLDAIAHHDARPWPDGFTVVTDARRKEVYWASYRNGTRTAGPAVSRPHDLAATLAPGTTVVGAGAVLYAGCFDGCVVDDRSPWPAAGDLARLANSDGWALASTEPLYLRRPDAQPPGPPKRVTAR